MEDSSKPREYLGRHFTVAVGRGRGVAAAEDGRETGGSGKAAPPVFCKSAPADAQRRGRREPCGERRRSAAEGQGPPGPRSRRVPTAEGKEPPGDAASGGRPVREHPAGTLAIGDDGQGR